MCRHPFVNFPIVRNLQQPENSLVEWLKPVACVWWYCDQVHVVGSSKFNCLYRLVACMPIQYNYHCLRFRRFNTCYKMFKITNKQVFVDPPGWQCHSNSTRCAVLHQTYIRILTFKYEHRRYVGTTGICRTDNCCCYSTFCINDAAYLLRSFACQNERL